MFGHRELLASCAVEAESVEFQAVGRTVQLQFELPATKKSRKMAGIDIGSTVRRKRHIRVGDHRRIDQNDAFGRRQRLVVNSDGGDTGGNGGFADGKAAERFRLVGLKAGDFRFWRDDFQKMVFCPQRDFACIALEDKPFRIGLVGCWEDALRFEPLEDAVQREGTVGIVDKIDEPVGGLDGGGSFRQNLAVCRWGGDRPDGGLSVWKCDGKACNQ